VAGGPEPRAYLGKRTAQYRNYRTKAGKKKTKEDIQKQTRAHLGKQRKTSYAPGPGLKKGGTSAGTAPPSVSKAGTLSGNKEGKRLEKRTG